MVVTLFAGRPRDTEGEVTGSFAGPAPGNAQISPPPNCVVCADPRRCDDCWLNQEFHYSNDEVSPACCTGTRCHQLLYTDCDLPSYPDLSTTPSREALPNDEGRHRRRDGHPPFPWRHRPGRDHHRMTGTIGRRSR